MGTFRFALDETRVYKLNDAAISVPTRDESVVDVRSVGCPTFARFWQKWVTAPSVFFVLKLSPPVFPFPLLPNQGEMGHRRFYTWMVDWDYDRLVMTCEFQSVS
jgi:hypothetical protein